VIGILLVSNPRAWHLQGGRNIRAAKATEALSSEWQAERVQTVKTEATLE
jgi:hypothetical protein